MNSAAVRSTAEFARRLPMFVLPLVMTITLRPDQEAWLSRLVEKGDYASVEAAASQLLDQKIAEFDFEENDDLAWAKPYVDDARDAIKRGEAVSLVEYKARTSALLRDLGVGGRANNGPRGEVAAPHKL